MKTHSGEWASHAHVFLILFLTAFNFENLQPVVHRASVPAAAQRGFSSPTNSRVYDWDTFNYFPATSGRSTSRYTWMQATPDLFANMEFSEETPMSFRQDTLETHFQAQVHYNSFLNPREALAVDQLQNPFNEPLFSAFGLGGTATLREMLIFGAHANQSAGITHNEPVLGSTEVHIQDSAPSVVSPTSIHTPSRLALKCGSTRETSPPTISPVTASPTTFFNEDNAAG